jgi:hypothetical protein
MAHLAAANLKFEKIFSLTLREEQPVYRNEYIIYDSSAGASCLKWQATPTESVLNLVFLFYKQIAPLGLIFSS